jgi:phosphatidate cytidylyltransferase
MLGVFYIVSPSKSLTLMVMAFMALFGFFLFTANRYDGGAFLTHCQELMYSIFGLVYLSLLPLFLPELRRLPGGREWLILFLLIVWSADTGAYFVGKKWGKTKLYSKVSPKKTVEGSIGGLLSSLAVALAFKARFVPQHGWLYIGFLALFVSGVSQVGDLCESLLKRAFDKKDSGSWLPGHGGFLDRFDSVVFSLPIMYAWIRIF